jgi:hypothetical protein
MVVHRRTFVDLDVFHDDWAPGRQGPAAGREVVFDAYRLQFRSPGRGPTRRRRDDDPA